MVIENKQDIYQYLLRNKQSLYTPLDLTIRSLEGKEFWVKRVLEIIPGLFDDKSHMEIISESFKSEVLKRKSHIFESFKNQSYSIDHAIWLLTKVPELAELPEMKEIVYQWIYSGVEHPLEMYESSLLSDFMEGRVTADELPYMFADEYPADSIPYLCNNRSEKLLWVIKDSHSEELLKLYIFKKLLYKRVLLHFAVKQTDLEQDLITCGLFKYDLLNSYHLLCSDTPADRKELFEKRLNRDDLRSFESGCGEEQTVELIRSLKYCNRCEQSGVPIFLDFLQSSSKAVKDMALQALSEIPRAYRYLLTKEFEKDKQIEKFLKKIYISEWEEISTEEQVTEWVKDKKRKKSFEVNRCIETTNNIDILYAVRDLCITGKISKYPEILDALAYNSNPVISSVLQEIVLCSKSCDVKERALVFLNWFCSTSGNEISALVEHSFLQRDESSYSKEYIKKLAQNEGKNRKVKPVNSKRSKEELMNLIGKRSDIKELKQLLRQFPIITIPHPAAETIFAIPIEKHVCLFETSIFYSRVSPGDYLTDFPEEFNEVELLNIGFYPYSGEDITFMFFHGKNSLPLDRIDSKLVSTVHALLSRCFIM